VLRVAFDFDQDRRLPWDTILYSCIKKSGKTTLNALSLWRGDSPSYDTDRRDKSRLVPRRQCVFAFRQRSRPCRTTKKSR